MSTPQDFRRQDVKEIFKKRLKDKTVNLIPNSISISESHNHDNTLVDFSFDMTQGDSKKRFSFERVEGKGFVDALFNTCFSEFIEEYSSLKNLSLVDLIVKPIFSMSKNNLKTDARTDVIFRLEIKNRGMTEFSSRSRSIVYSSFAATLEAFQFYINCDKTFKILKIVLDDAKQRHRGDVSQACISDLSSLTQVNTYG